METMWQDIRDGVRMLRKNPAFTAVVVLILAVGIGANTAVFSVVNAVLLRPLPYADADRLVMLQEHGDRFDMPPVHDRFLFWRQQNEVFEHMAGYCGCRPYVAGIDRPRYVWAISVLSDTFPLLGVQPLLGRGFLPEEEQAGKDDVVILSHDFWRDDLGGRPDAIGRAIVIDNRSCTIVGVMPPGFTFPIGRPRAFWVPLVYQRSADWPSGGLVFGLARLKKDCDLEQARAGMAVVAQRLKQTDPKAGDVVIQRLLDRPLGANRQILWLLLGAAGFVLLIACTNVASLLLARATVRQQEMAMRVALGASRGRIIRRMLAESFLLSTAGGLLGLLTTFLTIRLLVGLCPADIPRLSETSVDGSVLAFTLAASTLTGLLFGMMPAWRASDVHVSRILKEGQTRSSTGRGWRRFHGSLVVVQTSTSLILLIGAALLIRTWMVLQRTDLGFEPAHALTVDISLLESEYPVYDRCGAFFEPLLQQVRDLPGVRAAALVPYLDFGYDGGESPFTIIGRPPASPEEAPVTKFQAVFTGFFEAMGMRLLKGRTFTDEDTLETSHTAVIDENLMRRCFTDLDPIGQKIHFGGGDHTIVGVVSTVRDFENLNPAFGMLYKPLTRCFRNMVLIVRTDGDPLRLADAVRSQVASLETDQVIDEMQALDRYLADLLAPRRFSMILLSLFAGIALALAAAGIYGLLQYSTMQQTHDIGIRMALGAERTDVLKGVLRHGLRLTLAGVGVGVVGALALTRFVSHLLYGVPATDWATFVGVSLILTAVALLAAYLPARRAAQVDPMAALRCE